MNLIRLIVIGLIIYLVIQIIKRWQANKNAAASIKKSQQENMVRCETCQLHILESEALQQDGKYYCCQAHLENKHD